MATAAPAAPSSSAPSTAPAPAAPAQPSPGSISAPSPVTDAPGPDTAQRLRPIPPRTPRLPGVIPDEGDSFPAGPSSGSTDRPQPARGPDGRFVAPTATPADEGDHTLEPTAPPDAPPPAPTKFRFADTDFESQAAAEQSFKSLRGMYRPLQNLAKELGGLDKIPSHLRSAAESARGWKAEANRLAAELSRVQSGAAAPAASSPVTPTTTAPESEAAEPAIDYALYAEIRKIAEAEGTPWKAEQWLNEQVQAVTQAKIERMLEDRLAPFTSAATKAQTAQQTEALFGSLMEYAHPDGTPAFPELRNEESAYEIGRLWQSMGFPAEIALTPQGAVAAIAVYRLLHSARPAEPVASTAAAPVPAAVPPSPPPVAARAAATLDDGRPSTASLGNGSVSAEAARILSGLRSVNGQRARLGFDA